MTKLTKDQIDEMTPRQLRAYLDTHPEEGLRVWWYLWALSVNVKFMLLMLFISIKIRRFVKRIKRRE